MTRSDSATYGAEAAHQTTGNLPYLPRPDHDFSLVIPAYNEENRLPWTLTELRRFLDGSGIDYRVLVANDGSTDRTATFAAAMGSRFSTVSLPQNRGKGAAVRNAMLRTTGKIVAFTDADLPFELESLREAYELVRAAQCEVVFGARDLAQSTHQARRKLSRTIATWLFREVVKRLVSQEVTDTQCGLKAFSLRAAYEIFSRLTLDGFSFDAEVVFLTQRLGLEFRRIPVNLVREYGSTLSLRRHTIPMLRDIMGLWWRNRHLQELPRQQTQTETAAAGRHKAA
jgi:dolichyl-phosphate beta-glucosyltransferase